MGSFIFTSGCIFFFDCMSRLSSSILRFHKRRLQSLHIEGDVSQVRLVIGLVSQGG